MLFSEILLEDATDDLLAKIRSTLAAQRTTTPAATVPSTDDEAAVSRTMATGADAAAGATQAQADPATSNQVTLDYTQLQAAIDQAITAKNRAEIIRVLTHGPEATISRALQDRGMPDTTIQQYVERQRPMVQDRLYGYVEERYINTSQVPGVRRPNNASWVRYAQGSGFDEFVDAILRAVGG